tara:strand:- start:507 stop:1421 length:915 start_codon:yes stop_codon:yes gene_type:complete
MHSTNSFLYTVVERVRGYLDDPDLDAKYSDDFIIRHIILPCMSSVVSRVNNSLSNPIVSRLRVTLVEDQQYYQLPPTVGEVWSVCMYDTDTGAVTSDMAPRGFYSPSGEGWSIQGNQLSILPLPKTDTDIDIFYAHSGDLMLHYSITGILQSTTTLEVGTAVLGDIDRRVNAYAGSMLRLLPSDSANVIEERVILASTVDSNKSGSNVEITVRTPFDYHTEGSNIIYEIAPFGLQSMYEAIAAAGAMKLAAYKKITGTHYQMIQMQYRDAMKTVCDHYSNMQMRMPKHWDKDTWDNYDNVQVLP